MAMLPQAPLISAARLLADRGVYGLVWLTTELRVLARFGRIVDFVDIGQPITEAMWPLIGLEDEIYALAHAPGDVLSLPSVSVVNGGTQSPRLNITVIWSPADMTFVLVASRANTKTDLEVELSKQIRARLIAEAEVTRKSQELARANRDLEEFAAIISHDLKTPLRQLRFLAQDLEMQLGPELPEAMRSTLNRITDQSNRMSGMMTALLEYSSIGRKEEAIEHVDTRSIVNAIVQSMPRPASMLIEIEGSWPQIKTLAAPLDQVLRNLLSNAIRHHDRDAGTIKLQFEEHASAYRFLVVDDGPGIDPKHQEAIFLPFRTIASKEACEGHGMGLSLVKRTIESVGGAISVASDPALARGSTFTVSWPKTIGQTRQNG